MLWLKWIHLDISSICTYSDWKQADTNMGEFHTRKKISMDSCCNHDESMFNIGSIRVRNEISLLLYRQVNFHAVLVLNSTCSHRGFTMRAIIKFINMLSASSVSQWWHADINVLHGNSMQLNLTHNTPRDELSLHIVKITKSILWSLSYSILLCIIPSRCTTYIKVKKYQLSLLKQRT